MMKIVPSCMGSRSRLFFSFFLNSDWEEYFILRLLKLLLPSFPWMASAMSFCWIINVCCHGKHWESICPMFQLFFILFNVFWHIHIHVMCCYITFQLLRWVNLFYYVPIYTNFNPSHVPTLHCCSFCFVLWYSHII